MSSRHHIDDFMRGRIIGKIEEGRRNNRCCQGVRHRSQRCFTAVGSNLKLLECVVRRHGGGRVRITTPAEDEISSVSISLKRNEAHHSSAGGKSSFLLPQGSRSPENCCQTFEGRRNLYARRPVVCVPLTRQHHTARLQWCREHHNWTEQDWACVLFSDESRFSLSSDCRRQLIWRASGTAYRPENIQGKDRYPTCSIMVWARHHDVNGRTRSTCGCEMGL
ncbi:transposable element Tcb1 transposase [Trichonephila clavipes]|nr:transposable element Tcb1 transposase [Trichonephila clavipes]